MYGKIVQYRYEIPLAQCMAILYSMGMKSLWLNVYDQITCIQYGYEILLAQCMAKNVAA